MEEKLYPINVQIKNFQSIGNLNIEIYGFTCITGKSNIGKSAVVRSISSALQNNPVTSLVRKDASFCSVHIVSDQYDILWEKGERGINRTTVNGKVYDKIGQNQLEVISDLGFGCVNLGPKRLYPWFASQFEPIFLLNEHGPSVTDFISEVSRLRVIQDSIILSTRYKKRTFDESKIRSDDVAKLQDKLSKFQDLQDTVQLEKEIDAQVQSIREYEDKITLSEQVFWKMEKCTRKIDVLKAIDDLKFPDSSLENDFSDLTAKYMVWQKLESKAQKIIAIRDVAKLAVPEIPQQEWDAYTTVRKFEVIPTLAQRVKSLDPVKSIKLPDTHDLDIKFQKIKIADDIKIRVDALRSKIKKLSENLIVPILDPVSDGIEKLKTASLLEKNLKSIRQSIALHEKNLKIALDELRSIDEEISVIPLCPSCGRPGDKSHNHSVS